MPPEQPADIAEAADPQETEGQNLPPRKPTVDELAYGNYLMVYDIYVLMKQVNDGNEIVRTQIVKANARITEQDNRINELTERLIKAEQQVGNLSTTQDS